MCCILPNNSKEFVTPLDETDFAKLIHEKLQEIKINTEIKKPTAEEIIKAINESVKGG